MLFLIYLLILSILPCCSISPYTYGIIRNASIKIPFDIPVNFGHASVVTHCNECLCDAFRNLDKVYLFTCTRNASENFMCQFYYFMPKRDEIYYPRDDTNIYLIKDEKFEEKDDCCNTTYLVQKINGAPRGSGFTTKPLRFLVEGDHDTIVSTSNGQLHKFNRSTLELVYESNISLASFSTVGYYDKKYYLNNGQNIVVYDETLTSLIYTISLNKGSLTTIRFLSEKEMLVGVGDNEKGGYICKRNNKTENFTNCDLINGTNTGQVHAFGVVDENAFYVGWNETGQNLHLYTKDQNNSWVQNQTSTITHSSQTSDIFFDKKCKRVWTVEASQNRIFIYDQDKNQTGQITVDSSAFNLLILENYTLVISHGSSVGLSRISVIQPRLNCRIIH